jgi:plastocyanin
MATQQVQVGPGMVFAPDPVSISVGDTVEWIWAEDNHSTTSVDGLWDSGVLNTNARYPHTFPNAGSFSYYCTVHGPQMAGTVNVT